MKKLSFFALNLLLAATFTACEKVVGDGPMITEQRNVSNFSGIDLRMSGNVYFSQAPEYKVEVRAQDEILQVLDTYVSNGKLIIKFENDVKLRLHDGVTVNVSGPSLNSIRVSGSGDINCSGALISDDMEMDVSGSGDITVSNLTTGVLDASISGSGDIKVLQGIATEEKLRISGSGDIDLVGVAGQTATTRTSGSGTTKVQVSNRLDVTISGSGSVYYVGNPVINASISGSGKVRQQ